MKTKENILRKVEDYKGAAKETIVEMEKALEEGNYSRAYSEASTLESISSVIEGSIKEIKRKEEEED